MEQGTVFKSNGRQAILLPKAAAFPDVVKRVDIATIGRARIIVPAGESWDTWFVEESVTADFLTDRDQSTGQA